MIVRLIFPGVRPDCGSGVPGETALRLIGHARFDGPLPTPGAPPGQDAGTDRSGGSGWVAESDRGRGVAAGVAT
jgi:hypothetical protein